MATETKQSVARIIPDEHPHIFLCHFKEPFEGLTLNQAIISLHLRIATASHDELSRVSDTTTAFLAPRDSTPEERFEISNEILRAMLSIRAKELAA